MAKEDKIAFLCKRLKELREKNHCTMDEMAQKLAVNGIAPNKSSVSRVEEEKTSEKTMIETAKKYCEACLLPTDSEKPDERAYIANEMSTFVEKRRRKDRQK